MGPKLFRDPVYDYIQIDAKNSWLLDLIGTPEVQRLRYISQLGLSHFAYPGATHSRFSHVLGVLHLMQECVNHLRQTGHEVDLTEESLLAAALLHDIGHSPFSHATEEVFGDHEEKAVAMIKDTDSEVHKILSRKAADLPAKTAALIVENPEDPAPLWQKSLISSQLDMDRLDYLRRDALCSGAEYGNFDCFRIIHTMQLQKKVIQEESEQEDFLVVWPDKSKYAIEEYIFARYYMYLSVYFHHTTRGFEGLLKQILKRGRKMARDGKRFARTLLPPMRLLHEDGNDQSSFLGLTDAVVFAQITLWRNCNDKILSDLSNRLFCRSSMGWIELKGAPMELHKKIGAAREYLKKQRLDPEYYLYEDNTQTTPYTPYSFGESDELSSVTAIVFFDEEWSGNHFRELVNVPGLERLKGMRGADSALSRWYFPKEHKDKMKELLR